MWCKFRFKRNISQYVSENKLFCNRISVQIYAPHWSHWFIQKMLRDKGAFSASILSKLPEWRICEISFKKSCRFSPSILCQFHKSSMLASMRNSHPEGVDFSKICRFDTQKCNIICPWKHFILLYFIFSPSQGLCNRHVCMSVRLSPAFAITL